MFSQAFEKTFFDPGHPLLWMDRLLNRFTHQQTVFLQNRALQVVWTRRAQQQLQNRQQPLAVDMQMLFACVLKKRVLFGSGKPLSRVSVTPFLAVGLTAVASKVCNPEDFARDYPEGRDLSDTYAGRVIPRRLEIDFRQGQWQGRFYIG